MNWIEGRGDFSYAGANNQGAELAAELGAKALFFLNNDTEVEANFLDEMLKTFCSEKNKNTNTPGPVVIPTILFDCPGNIIWAQGSRLDYRTGNQIHISEGLNISEGIKKETRVDGLTGCAFLIETETYFDLNGMDESYFLYTEDVAFWLKLSELGHSIILSPASVIRHKVSRSTGGSESPMALFYHFRNRIRLILENERLKKHKIAIPLTILGVFIKSFSWIFSDRTPLLRASWLGIFDGILRRSGKIIINRDGFRQIKK